jgi:hypothetical protein
MSARLSTRPSLCAGRNAGPAATARRVQRCLGAVVLAERAAPPVARRSEESSARALDTQTMIVVRSARLVTFGSWLLTPECPVAQLAYKKRIRESLPLAHAWTVPRLRR